VSEAGFLLFFFLVLVVAIGVAALAHQAKLRRQKELGAVARNQGLDFSIPDRSTPWASSSRSSPKGTAEASRA
jgi:hypothetical protein